MLRVSTSLLKKLDDDDDDDDDEWPQHTLLLLGPFV